jgi:hypothetical protein
VAAVRLWPFAGEALATRAFADLDALRTAQARCLALREQPDAVDVTTRFQRRMSTHHPQAVTGGRYSMCPAPGMRRNAPPVV